MRAGSGSERTALACLRTQPWKVGCPCKECKPSALALPQAGGRTAAACEPRQASSGRSAPMPSRPAACPTCVHGEHLARHLLPLLELLQALGGAQVGGVQGGDKGAAHQGGGVGVGGGLRKPCGAMQRRLLPMRRCYLQLLTDPPKAHCGRVCRSTTRAYTAPHRMVGVTDTSRPYSSTRATVPLTGMPGLRSGERRQQHGRTTR